MKNRKIPLILAGIAVMLMTVGSCAEPPATRITQARLALGNLRDISQADQWAPEELASAEEALQTAEAELTLQQRRFALTRDYTKSIDLLESAIADAEAARIAAEQGKKAAEKQAREALDAAMSAINHAWAAMIITPVSTRRGSASSRIDVDLTEAERGLEEVRNMIVAEQYREATVKAEQILDSVSSLVRSVSDRP